DAAIKLAPDMMGPMLNLGLCNEQLDRYATALRWYRRAQTRASELSIASAEEAAKTRAGNLAQHVPKLVLERRVPLPAASVIAVHGAPVAEIDLGQVEVDAGRHAVTVTSPSGARWRLELDIRDDEAKPVALVAPVEPAKPEPVDRSGEFRKRAF